MGEHQGSKDATELFLRHLFRRATLAALTAAPLSACHVAHGPGQIGPLDDAGRTSLEGGGMQSDAEVDAAGHPDASGPSSVDAGSDASGDGGGAGNGGGAGDAGGGGGGEGGVDEVDLLTACETQARSVSAAGVNPAQPVDYLAVRRRYNFGDPVQGGGVDGWGAFNFEVLSETGTSCATATTDACAAKVPLMPAEFTLTGGIQVGEETSVVTTAGDTVEHYAGAARLRELFGDVDTLDEAWLLAASDNLYPCGGREVDGELRIFAKRTTNDCAPIITMIYELHVSSDGQTEVLRSAEYNRDESACIGRRPEGLAQVASVPSRDALGDYLARCAHLEAASVDAFEQLALDLMRLGAPADLVRRAREAADDERRHAQSVGALSLSRGAAPAKVDVAAVGERSLEAIATENAVEGCVRETFGVLVGAHQALRAEAADIRDAMAPIVRDETRHAALSWDVHLWALATLEPAARARVLSHQREAVARLEASLCEEPAAELRREAGLPAAEPQLAMFAQLRRTLWQA